MSQSNFKLLIGTPCYNGLIHQDYFKSTVEYSSLGFPIMYMHIGNESLITRGRNAIISMFYEHRENFTHLLFLDADIYLGAKDLMKLLDSGEDVIGAAVPMKGFDPTGKPVYNIGEVISKQGHVIEVERVGTAVMMLSVKAVESLVNDAKESGFVYVKNKLSRGDGSADVHYDVFRVGVFDEEYLSEDYFVCKNLREMGYKIMVDASVSTRHSGMYTWQG